MEIKAALNEAGKELPVQRGDRIGKGSMQGHIEGLLQGRKQALHIPGKTAAQETTEAAVKLRRGKHLALLKQGIGKLIELHRTRVARMRIKNRQYTHPERKRAVDLSETEPYSADNLKHHASRFRMADNKLKTLEEKIDQLIALCAQLNRENRALKEENLNFQQERRDLIAKNELARARVEATLQRLRSMEAAS